MGGDLRARLLGGGAARNYCPALAWMWIRGSCVPRVRMTVNLRDINPAHALLHWVEEKVYSGAGYQDINASRG